MAHGELYAAEFGWDASFEGLVVRIVADFASGNDPLGNRRGSLSSTVGASAACSASARTSRPGSCGSCWSTRSLAVPAWGAASSTIACASLESARYQQLVLWTNDPLVAARRIYLTAGFRLVDEQRTTALVSTWSANTMPSISAVRTALRQRLSHPVTSAEPGRRPR